MMTSTADIEQAIAEKIASFLYSSDVSGNSISQLGFPVKISRGWPQEAELAKDLMSENPAGWVVVNQKSGMTQDRTRYGRGWYPLSENGEFGLTVQNAAEKGIITFTGTASLPGVAGVVLKNVAYPVSVSVGDTSTLLVQKISSQIEKVGAVKALCVGSTITADDDPTAYGAAAENITIERELCRVEDGFSVSIFAPSITSRDALEGGVMQALASLDSPLIENSSVGPIKYVKRELNDSSLNANLYRLDLTWKVEYAWTAQQSVAPTLWPVGIVNSSWGFGLQGAYKPSDLPPVGAIRFDAWYDMSNKIDEECASALSDSKWKYRLPAESEIDDQGNVTWAEADQATMDAEINAALDGKLSFWAFDSYNPNDTLSKALSLYLSSSSKGGLRFCMLGQSSNWGDSSGVDGYSSAFHRDINFTNHADYFTVLGGRPVYLILDASSAQLSLLPDGLPSALSYFRDAVIKTTGFNPYIVYLSGASIEDYDNVAAAMAAGADASGAYCTPRLNGAPQPYSALCAATESDWSLRSKSGFPMVPTAMTGWDQRPLIENQQPFYPIASYLTSSNYYDTGTPSQIADHVIAMEEFISNTASITSGFGLIYAWNEFAEGGWLAPTYGGLEPNRDRVEALGSRIIAAEAETVFPSVNMILNK